MIARSLEKTSCKEYRKETRNETNCGELLGGEKKGESEGVEGGEGVKMVSLKVQREVG